MRMDIRLSTSTNSTMNDMENIDLKDFSTDAELQMAIARLNNGSLSPRSRLDQEKRLRREIANSNERRRMQSINSGFQSLKSLLPRKDGEKMSKASILQQTADYIMELQAEKAHLIQQNVQLRQLLELKDNSLSGSASPSSASSVTLPTVPQMSPDPFIGNTQAKLRLMSTSSDNVTSLVPPPKKRRKFGSSDSSDEGICLLSDMDISESGSTASRTKTSPVNDSVTTPKHSQPPSSTIQHSQDDSITAEGLASYGCSAFMQTGSAQRQAQLASLESVKQKQQESEQSVNAAELLRLGSIWESELVGHQLFELRLALERERRARLVLEDHLRTTEINNRLSSLKALSCYSSSSGVELPISPSSINTISSMIPNATETAAASAASLAMEQMHTHATIISPAGFFSSAALSKSQQQQQSGERKHSGGIATTFHGSNLPTAPPTSSANGSSGTLSTAQSVAVKRHGAETFSAANTVLRPVAMTPGSKEHVIVQQQQPHVLQFDAVAPDGHLQLPTVASGACSAKSAQSLPTQPRSGHCASGVGSDRSALSLSLAALQAAAAHSALLKPLATGGGLSAESCRQNQQNLEAFCDLVLSGQLEGELYVDTKCAMDRLLGRCDNKTAANGNSSQNNNAIEVYQAKARLDNNNMHFSSPAKQSLSTAANV